MVKWIFSHIQIAKGGQSTMDSQELNKEKLEHKCEQPLQTEK